MAARFGGLPEISPEEIRLLHPIGGGAFGTVWSGICRSTQVAVKVVTHSLDEGAMRSFRNEVAIMSKVAHPNVCLFMGACTSKSNEISICMELLSNNLESLLLDTSKHMPLAIRLTMATEAALGVSWLHSSNPAIIHRDLKTSNLLVDQHNHVKVCDFGLSELRPNGQAVLRDKLVAKGTPLWMAPEVLRGQGFNEKADVYSFGLVLWQILTRAPLFPSYTVLSEFATDICNNNIRPPIPRNSNPGYVDLMQRCWDGKPENRPDFPYIVSNLRQRIIHVIIPDPPTNQFWLKFFQYQTAVPWSAFLDAFSCEFNLVPEGRPLSVQYAGTPDISTTPLIPLLQSMQEVLVENDSDIVTRERMAILDGFGSISEGIGLAQKIHEVIGLAYFHGNISTSNTALLLAAPKSWLVRFSGSELGYFVFSWHDIVGGISHKRFRRLPTSNSEGIFTFDDPPGFPTLQELVQDTLRTLSLGMADAPAKPPRVTSSYHTATLLPSAASSGSSASTSTMVLLSSKTGNP
ncbi:SHK1 protein [Pelomyxa schiedti]|nr:SHK1 protein [Pelomyxa schiedti]